MRMPNIVCMAALVLAVASCGDPSDDRFETIAKLKVIGVRAEKPELHPGDTTRIDVLLAAPDKVTVTTFVMPFSAMAVQQFGDGTADFTSAGMAYNFVTGTTYPCPPFDVSALPRCLAFDLATAGLAVPGVSRSYYQAPVTPATYYLAVGATEGLLELSPNADLAEVQRRSLKAIKEIRVRKEGEELNRNPEPTGMKVLKRWRIENAEATVPDRVPIEPGGFTIEADELMRITPVFNDETPERVSVTWWLSAGAFDGYGRQDADFRSPDKPGIATLIALLLDRTGGNNWFVQDIAVRPADLKPEVQAPYTTLVRSAGRLFWLGFPEDASAAVMAAELRKGEPVVVGGTLTPMSGMRLGWQLVEPVYLGHAADITEPVITASDIDGLSAAFPVRMRLDEIIR